jgi:subtilase family serine protease
MAGLQFIYPASGAPDLRVEAVSVSPASIAAGGSITVSYRIANRGTGAVSGSYVERISLSSNATVDSGDTLLLTTAVRNTPLAANATLTFSQTVTVPSGFPSGSYFIIVHTDGHGGVSEGNELNNSTATRLTVQTGAPDLVVSALSAPSSAVIGTTILVTDTTRNQGNATAGSSTTQFFLSADTILGPGDHLVGGRAVGSLAAGATSSGSTSVTIPVGMPPGNYFLLAGTDALGLVPEGNELNNSRGVALVVTDGSASTATSGVVSVSDANGQAAADAVRFVRVP